MKSVRYSILLSLLIIGPSSVCADTKKSQISPDYNSGKVHPQPLGFQDNSSGRLYQKSSSGTPDNLKVKPNGPPPPGYSVDSAGKVYERSGRDGVSR